MKVNTSHRNKYNSYKNTSKKQLYKTNKKMLNKNKRNLHYKRSNPYHRFPWKNHSKASNIFPIQSNQAVVNEEIHSVKVQPVT